MGAENAILKVKSEPKRQATKPASAIPRARPAAPARVSFPIVGVGASAGGLEALEQFLGHVPIVSGMAYVIVQHLAPTHKGVMPQLLQRATGMKVMQVKDRTKVRPDCVYVIPPNKDMSLLHGLLHLFEPTASRGLRLPIDFFFRSLALDAQERSAGVILSGMGSDGTLGLRAIKEEGGVVLVQDPASAKFDSMPRSAIDAGVVDIVAPVDELPEKIVAFFQRPRPLADTEVALEEKAQNALEKVIILLRAHTGHDFTLYKRNTLYRRAERRMGVHQINKLAAYVRYLQENTQELDLLFKELLIGVTRFFRDPTAWELLRTQAIPKLLAGLSSAQQPLRAWVPGCSTGEEAYSLAIVFKEALEHAESSRHFALQIFATDLDLETIDRGRQGFFPAGIVADVSPERLDRFFVKDEHGYRVSKEIREMVIFAQQNLIMDPPFTKLDILSCRNLLIYLTAEVQKKLMPLFHYSLNPDGLLLLGNAEAIGGFTDLFVPLSAKERLFQRRESVLRPKPVEFPASFSTAPSGGPAVRPPVKPPVSLQSLANQMVLQRYAPPTVLVNEKGDILYISGRTGKYLEPAAGKANWNIFVMANEGLRYELSDAFQKALRQKESVALYGLKVRTDAGEQWLNVTVQRLDEPGPLQGLLMIVFNDVVAPAAAEAATRRLPFDGHSPRVAELEQEVQRVRADAVVNREEMQTTQEELMSSNEELQSTNEELITSKEGMQSLNEELQTVNSELQAKLDELSRASNDIRNLLNSTNIATLFLDNELNVRRFTPLVAKIIKLIPGDVGRPVTDLVSNLDYLTLADDVREVLQTLAAIEKPVVARDGRWFNVHIMPYRTLDDRIDGVVITFTDITVSRTIEAKLRAQQASLRKHVAKQSSRLAKARKGAPAEAAASQPIKNRPEKPRQSG
jgi:two-component system CheB/CheR fusion protein